MIRILFSLSLLLFSLQSLPSIASPENCVSCHSEQTNAWQQSDHAKAMAKASPTSVLANFDDVKVEHYGQKARFYRKNVSGDSQYWLDIDYGEKAQSLQIEYTFGHYPLQQYLVQTKPGSYHIVPFAWDTRPENQGGQRWYHIYQQEEIKPQDRLHWRQPLQNWNGMCADCHSDGLKRNYNAAEDRFDTSWDNINVGCQSCHGEMADDHSKPSLATVDKLVGGWQLSRGEKIAKWVGDKRDNAFMDSCFACHSLRSPLTDGISASTAFLDQFSPSLLEQPLYFDDGQIKEEVYVYGSFLQSKMHQAGVNCLDCHDKHTMKVKIPDNGLCLQCHNSDNYQSEKHTGHALTSAGSQCVECHMPERTYMGVDERRDHSFSIPRPHLADTFDIPSACQNCHDDKSNKWAAESLVKLHGKPQAQSQSELDFIHLMAGQYVSAEQHLQMINDTTLAEIKRASAIMHWRYTGQPLTDAMIQPWLNSDLPLLRLATAKMGNLLAIEDRLHAYKDLLNDAYKAVRVAAAEHLVATGMESNAVFVKAYQELLHANAMSAWRGEGNLNQSLLDTNQGKYKQAIASLQHSINIDPYFESAYVNLAELYRNTGQAQQETATYRLGLQTNPTSAVLNYSFGMHQIRAGNKQSALSAFNKAIKYEASNPQYALVYFLTLDSLGQTQKALRQIKSTLRKYNYDPQLFELGVSYARKLNDQQSMQYFQKVYNSLRSQGQ
ncbi:hypothetical protein E2K93_07580 [Thalassotalea sp. HSM 43]|uniref:multiheme c-type cytochrome n=1 Tax=Thalassotalea sp. HSM 43 TaxID=2552945 RepID=UPI0010822354|nr:multiheme c-type cytochrome [Thalassotalea sp. HSM 43]QBY04257.1 hypothetical protein E2K93_07580 [Thalassotalea sp. HSM 43]